MTYRVVTKDNFYMFLYHFRSIWGYFDFSFFAFFFFSFFLLFPSLFGGCFIFRWMGSIGYAVQTLWMWEYPQTNLETLIKIFP